MIKKVVVKRVREKVGQNDAEANKDNTDKTTLGDMKGLDKKDSMIDSQLTVPYEAEDVEKIQEEMMWKDHNQRVLQQLREGDISTTPSSKSEGSCSPAARLNRLDSTSDLSDVSSAGPSASLVAQQLGRCNTGEQLSKHLDFDSLSDTSWVSAEAQRIMQNAKQDAEKAARLLEHAKAMIAKAEQQQKQLEDANGKETQKTAEAEANKKKEEDAKKAAEAEEERKKAQDAKKAEEERQKAEDAKKTAEAEEERKKAEEAKRAEEERKKAEDAKKTTKAEEERKKGEVENKKPDDAKRHAEHNKALEEKQKAEEAMKVAQEMMEQAKKALEKAKGKEEGKEEGKETNGEALVDNTEEERKKKELAQKKASAHARYMRYYRNIRRTVLRYHIYFRLQF